MSRKESNAKLAKDWVETVTNHPTYKKAIEKSIATSQVVTADAVNRDIKFVLDKVASSTECGEIVITEDTTYNAIIKEYDNGEYAIGALNFASFYKPGGGFLKGAYTQEESLCHTSGLYPILEANPIYGERAKDKDVPDEYRSEVIYSKGVPFTAIAGEITAPILVDVMSCAAPNCHRVPISKLERVDKAIKERLTACYILPYLNGCNVLVLGAWGCGIFANNPMVVASVFKQLNDTYGNLYKRVIYALPNLEMRLLFEDIMR